MKNIQLQIVTDIDETLIKQWKDLWLTAENASLFNSYEWFLTCQTAKKITSYELFVCFKDKKLIAILPTVKMNRFGISSIASLCDDVTIDTPFLMKNYSKELMKEFFTYVTANRNMYISKVDPKATTLLHSIFPEMVLPIIATCPYISVEHDALRWVEKSTLKTVEKGLEKNAGVLEYKTYTTNLEKHLQTMFTIDQQSGKQKRKREIFSKSETRDLYKTIVKNCKQFIRINILYYNKKPIAYQFGFQYKNTYSGYQTSYLYEYRKLNPGKTMIILLLKSLQNDKINIIHFGGGISSYKMEFTKEYSFQYDIYAAKNIYSKKWWELINLARRINKVLFPEKYTRDHEFQYKLFKENQV